MDVAGCLSGDKMAHDQNLRTERFYGHLSATAALSRTAIQKVGIVLGVWRTKGRFSFVTVGVDIKEHGLSQHFSDGIASPRAQQRGVSDEGSCGLEFGLIRDGWHYGAKLSWCVVHIK